MGYHAVDDLGDALTAVKTLLVPVELGLWARLALVALFVGGGGIGLNAPVQTVSRSPISVETPGRLVVPSPGMAFWLALVVVSVAVLVGIAVAILGAVLELVFVESLRERTVRVRRFARRRLGQGVRLFLFRLALGLVGLVATALVFGLALLPLLVDLRVLTVLGMLVAVPVGLVVGLLLLLANFFTAAFVVPVMVLTGEGPVDGWRRLWPTLRADLEEVGVFVLVSAALAVARGIVVGTAGTIGAVLLLVPFGAVGLVGIGLLDVSAVLGWALLAVVVLAYGLSLVVLLGFVKAPVLAYLRYFGILVLGDLEADLDLVPDLRAEIRAEAGESGDDGAAGA